MIRKFVNKACSCVYDDTEYENKVTHLRYIGKGKDIRLPKGYTSCYKMFEGYEDISTMHSRCTLDLTNFDTSEVTDMRFMFSSIKVNTLDLKNFDTSKVTDMSAMFFACNCSKLDVSSFNTENVVYMTSMFRDFTVLTKELDLSNFKLDSIENTSVMFLHCKCERLGISSLVTNRNRKIENMFADCDAIIHRGSQNKLMGIEEFNSSDFIDSTLKKYKLLGLEEPTIYRKMR